MAEGFIANGAKVWIASRSEAARTASEIMSKSKKGGRNTHLKKNDA